MIILRTKPATQIWSVDLLTELSPSWEAANCLATQELPSILWNPKFHYRVPVVYIQSQIVPVHTIPSYPIFLRYILILPVQSVAGKRNDYSENKTSHTNMISGLTYGAEPFLRSCQLFSHSRVSQHFMEPEVSLPCSTGPYPESDCSSPYHFILSYLSKIYFNIAHPPTSWSS
jgi:hypothetical protein